MLLGSTLINALVVTMLLSGAGCATSGVLIPGVSVVPAVPGKVKDLLRGSPELIVEVRDNIANIKRTTEVRLLVTGHPRYFARHTWVLIVCLAEECKSAFIPLAAIRYYELNLAPLAYVSSQVETVSLRVTIAMVVGVNPITGIPVPEKRPRLTHRQLLRVRRIVVA